MSWIFQHILVSRMVVWLELGLIPPSIYDLDLDMANSCWFVTTALLAVALPVLLVIVQLF
ncbi:MAG: hypothetical protein EG828_12605 [Deltaproteobacteria bacterium]|nr:hypothetical protein [Deltaproteobacteria bacterium]